MCTYTRFEKIDGDRIVYAVRQYYDGGFRSPWFGDLFHCWQLNEKEVATSFSKLKHLWILLKKFFKFEGFQPAGAGYFHTFSKLEDAKEYCRILSEDVYTFGYYSQFVVCKFKASGNTYLGSMRVSEHVDHETITHSFSCVISRELTMLGVLNETKRIS